MKFVSLALSIGTAAPGVMAVDDPAYRLVWSDEFNIGSEINRKYWTVIEGNGCPQLCGFGNDELQIYSSDKRNLRLEDGKLVIEAHAGENYTSAKVTTQKIPGWTYGKIEARAKLPKGVGTWPAVWMLPDMNKYGNWPHSGEIDIMEHVGFREGYVHGTVHTGAYNHRINTHKGQDILVAGATDTFKTYTIEWDEEHISWYIDGEKYFDFSKKPADGSEEWPFDQPIHLILNLAVGGQWGGKEGIDKEAFPARYEIDWVRVWQKKND